MKLSMMTLKNLMKPRSLKLIKIVQMDLKNNPVVAAIVTLIAIKEFLATAAVSMYVRSLRPVKPTLLEGI